MKKITKIVLVCLLFIWPTMSSSDYRLITDEEQLLLQLHSDILVSHLDSIENAEYQQLMVDIKRALNQVEIAQFMNKLALRESSGDWKVVNRFGFVGKYQFGQAARKTVGAPQFTPSEFIKDPNIWPEKEQDSAAFKLMKANYRYLNRHFNKPGDKLTRFYNRTFVLKDRSKVLVTLAGMIAASHLVGPKSVRQFLNTRGRIDKEDGNGTKCSDYMKHFQSYNMVLASE